MKNIEVKYEVFRDNEAVLQDKAIVKLTDKNISEISQYILSNSEYQTGELVCVPSHVYDRIVNFVNEDAISKLNKRNDGLYESDEIALEDYLPESLITLLPEDIVKLLPLSYTDDSEEVVNSVGEKIELPKPDKSNTLYLTIKQVYFDQIISGDKKEEYREVKETTYKKFIETDDEGNVFFDNNLITEKKLSEYYAEDSLYIYNDGVCPLLPKNNLFYLNLAVGYNKVRDTALVEVIDISFEIAKDNSGNEVRFNIDDSGNVVFAPDGKLCVWIAVLHLGNIVEKNIVSK